MHANQVSITALLLGLCAQGDRLDTDIVLGAEGGLRTIMPLTGVTTLEELNDAIKVRLGSCCPLPWNGQLESILVK